MPFSKCYVCRNKCVCLDYEDFIARGIDGCDDYEFEEKAEMY